MTSGSSPGVPCVTHLTLLTYILREHNLATARFVLESLIEVFPDTQVVPSLGNHEPFPCNMWAVRGCEMVLTVLIQSGREHGGCGGGPVLPGLAAG